MVLMSYFLISSSLVVDILTRAVHVHYLKTIFSVLSGASGLWLGAALPQFT